MTIRDLKSTMLTIIKVELYSERLGPVGAILLGQAEGDVLDLCVDTLIPVDRETIRVIVDEERTVFTNGSQKAEPPAAPADKAPAVVCRKPHPLRALARLLRGGRTVARRERSRRGVFARPDLRLLADLQPR